MAIDRRRFAQQTLGAALLGSAPFAHAAAPDTSGRKVLRYAFEVAETSLDPVKINDLYSRMLVVHMFEAPLGWDPLARPVKLQLVTAAAMPESSADFRTWTVRLKPGIYFADDPAFKGVRRELVAEDIVYTLKRYADPANKSPGWTSLAEDRIVGLAELRQQAIDTKKPLDYDRPVEGARALDRYTLQIRLADPRPRYGEEFAGAFYQAMAREVFEYYGDRVDAHPVGTGPFVLKEWRRSSFLAFERNPNYRERVYEADPRPDDAEGQAIAAKLRGRRLPMVDRVEVSIIEEEQPRWLSFLNGEADVAYRVGYQFIKHAMPNGRIAPNLAKMGIVGRPFTEPATQYLLFNMEDPIVGGYQPGNIALRRAIGLGMNIAQEIDHAYGGMGAPLNQPLAPFTTGHDPGVHTEFGTYDPARARALLDIHGYRDRDGDGWREMPDGSPLLLRMAGQSDGRTRKVNEVFKRSMDELQLRTVIELAQWPENLKAARAGKVQMWALGGYAASRDGAMSLARFHSKQIGGQNMARFRLPAMDRVYERLQLLPDGPEREALFVEATKLAVAYMPYKMKLIRKSLDMTWSHVVGYRRPVFWQEWWHQVDIDHGARGRA